MNLRLLTKVFPYPFPGFSIQQLNAVLGTAHLSTDLITSHFKVPNHYALRNHWFGWWAFRIAISGGITLSKRSRDTPSLA